MFTKYNKCLTEYTYKIWLLYSSVAAQQDSQNNMHSTYVEQ